MRLSFGSQGDTQLEWGLEMNVVDTFSLQISTMLCIVVACMVPLKAPRYLLCFTI
jgi:hypothetical protein